MEFLNLFPVELDRILNLLSSVVGIAGFLFGLWRYFKERKAHRTLADREQQLKQALERLDHLRTLSGGLTEYAKAV
jgi:hypothetical protein